MHAFYKIHYYDTCMQESQESTGIVIGEDEGDLVMQLKDMYGEFDTVGLHFSENWQENVISDDEIQENLSVDFFDKS